ncbi:MAG: hypothetical protein CMO55_12430 [Verrucomicrobiales bacterium]|nr:hypothetical protein [Verrucomicrobiales bacterium]
MTLQYRNTHWDYYALFEAQSPDAEKTAARNYYSRTILWWGLLAFGAYVGYMAEMLFATCLFVVALIYWIWHSVPYSRTYRNAVLQAMREHKKKEISLTIDDKGLAETVSDVVSIAPWKAFVGYILTDTHLIIELACGSFAIIPKDEISEGAEHLDELAAMLKEKNVPNRITMKS